jgi:hypothetical protein
MTTRIDCDTCVVRGLACGDCVVTVLLGPPPELTFDDDACRALDVLPRAAWCPRCGWCNRGLAGDRVRLSGADDPVSV